MAAENELNPTDYISHHLTNMTSSMGQGDFWVVACDAAPAKSSPFCAAVIRSVYAGVKRSAVAEVTVNENS
ncbi:MAG TPA: hypothetical protein VF523_00050, partial [Burkholderiales bacterium]